MRWIHKHWADGEKRVRSGFLFIPRSATLGDREYVRWLEHAAWEEKRVCGWGDDYWVTVRWMDGGDNQ